MHKYQYIILFSALFFALACKTQKETAVETKQEPRAANVDTRTTERVTALFIDANREKSLGNFQQAVNLFRQCLNLNPGHDPSMYELSRIYRMQGNITESLRLAENAVSLDSDNKWYQLLLASLYEQTGQNNKAIQTYEKLILNHPNDLALLFEISMLYLKENRFADAIAVYDRIERISGPDEDLIIQKQKLYLMNNQPEKAIMETEKLIGMYPGESRYYALLAELYLDLDNYPKAIENLEKIRELDPQNPYIHITLAEYYFKIGKREDAFEELKQGFANPGLEIEIKFQVMLAYYSNEEIYGEYKDQINELTAILIETHPNDARPYSMKADMLIQDEKYEEAREAFRKLLKIDKSRFFMWETLLRLNAILRDNDAMLEDALIVIELFPLQPLPYLFAGLAHYQDSNYEQAVLVLKKGKDMVVDDDELLSEFYMHLGDCYSKLKQHEASDSSFEQALALDPENPYVLNNYSYYLALRKERLEYAEKMSAKSLEISPDNKHYLDTYGWIMYQLGRYEEARKWIEKSIDNNASEDAVVLEHMGDVLYKLGKKEEALMYWIQALEAGGETSAFLERKVKDGILYE